MSEPSTGPRNLSRFAWLSIGAAVVTIALKSGAYLVTGSVGLLSDAIESLVNLVAAVLTLAMVTLASRAPDDRHTFGYGKAEYFSSGVEGTLILLAAAAIAYTAIRRILSPAPIDDAWLGIAISTGASGVNLIVGRILIASGRKHHSVALEADGHHLMTDVWTSVGVIIGITLVAISGITVLDPLIALGVAAQIVWTGAKIVRLSALGLLDRSLPQADLDTIQAVLKKHDEPIQFHALRTRQAGQRKFVSLHVLVPGTWSVARGHTLLEQIEGELREALSNASVFTHLEPVEDPRSFEDQSLDREGDPLGP